MTRLCGWCQRGQRLLGKVPHGHWKTLTLVAALRQQGVYFEQLIIPDEIHGFLRHGSWLLAYHRAVDFFKRKL